MGIMMPENISSRVRKHRIALREAGMRPLQIWVPNTRSECFVQECQRQSRLVAQAEQSDTDLNFFLDAVLSDIDGWEA